MAIGRKQILLCMRVSYHYYDATDHHDFNKRIRTRQVFWSVIVTNERQNDMQLHGYFSTSHNFEPKDIYTYTYEANPKQLPS